MINKTLNEITVKLDEIAKFVKFRRKQIRDQVKELLVTVDDKISSLHKSKETLATVNKVYSKKNKKLNNENKEITLKLNEKNEDYNALSKISNLIVSKYELVSQILSAESPRADELQKFKGLLYNAFMEFANKESSLAEEAQAVLLLQKIEKELELIMSFPSVHSKTILAIGGGFSSGKSKFVNSFFERGDIELPIGIKPVTAIPTYVIHDPLNAIYGYSNNGGRIVIDEYMYKKLSHDFVTSFSFNLKNIMPFMTINTSLPPYFKNICMIDTPGYNPGATDGYTENDKETALKFLKHTNALIWMIGLDVNGTIPASDLEFLNELDLTDTKVFIVANKADLKDAPAIKEIIIEIQKCLEDCDIDFVGISAFSSNKKREYEYINQSIFDFFNKINNVVNKQNQIIKEIDIVFDMYLKAFNKNIKKIKDMKSTIKSLELDLLELGNDSEDNNINRRIAKMQKSLSVSVIETEKGVLKGLRKNMKDAINEIFRSITT